MDPNRKSSVLILLSTADGSYVDAPGGVSALSFIQSYVLITSANLNVVVATPDGSAPNFNYEDTKCEQWVKSRQSAVNAPRAIEDIDVADYAGLVVPSCAGGLTDFIHERTAPKIARVVLAFVEAVKPVCAVGFGITALFSAKQGDKWVFAGKNATCISNFDLARFPYFSKLPIIPEDGVTDNGGKFSTGSIDQVYVVIDGRLITGQNVQSTSLAVQNLVWLCKYENGIVR